MRLFVEGVALVAATELELPPAAAAHVKVRRLQPGDALRLFDGRGDDDWPAEVVALTRTTVRVRLGVAPVNAAPELALAVALAFVMPANERMDALVEKATELGAAALWPLVAERSVLRLEGERAERRRLHWQAVAVAACEQCGRARVPRVHAVQPLARWLAATAPAADAAQPLEPARRARPADFPADKIPAEEAATLRVVLSTQPDAPPLATLWPRLARPASARAEVQPTRALAPTMVFLSGPEGGLTPQELGAATAAGFIPASLGPRVLRADTAPLAALAWLAVVLAGVGPAG
ncbi:MAG: 16S rRNA (uracil(1498)-N(3))-methyltransferase [Rubrivivax sp.]|nr:16S rRNA (uracil(1498)-N(3))-methyltransferase [Rubrivivax sp.]